MTLKYNIVDVLRAAGYPALTKVEGESEPVKNLPCPVDAHSRQTVRRGPAMVYPPKTGDPGSLVCPACGESWSTVKLKQVLGVSDESITEGSHYEPPEWPTDPSGLPHKAAEVEAINIQAEWLAASARADESNQGVRNYFLRRWHSEELADDVHFEVGWTEGLKSPVWRDSHPLLIPLWDRRGVVVSGIRRHTGTDKTATKSLRLPNLAVGLRDGTHVWLGDKPAKATDDDITSQTLWIAEGEIDTVLLLTLKRIGRIDGIVLGIPGGTGNSDKWWEATRGLFDAMPKSVVICSHNDEAGDRYWRKGKAHFPTAQRVPLPEGRDITDIARDDGIDSACEVLHAARASDSRFYRLDSNKWAYRAGNAWYIGVGKEALHCRLTGCGYGPDECKKEKATMPSAAGLSFDPSTTDRVVFNSGNTWLNTYAGMPLQPEEGDWQIVHKLITHLCNYDNDAVEHMLDWLAAPLQAIYSGDGAKRNKSALVLYGSQGTGKGLMFGADGLMRAIYGNYHTEITHESLSDKFEPSRFTECLLLSANEVAASGVRDVKILNRLKAWITEPVISVRQMRRESREFPIYFNMVFMSNDIHPVRLESTDRRYSTFRQKVSLQATPELTALLGQLLHDRDDGWPVAKAFLHHLLSREVVRDLSVPYKNESRIKLIELGRPSSEIFAREVLDSGFEAVSEDLRLDRKRRELEDEIYKINYDEVLTTGGGRVVSTVFVPRTHLYEVYKYWCMCNGIKHPVRQAHLLDAICETIEGTKCTQRRINNAARHGISGIPETGMLELVGEPAESRPPAAQLVIDGTVN